MAKKSTPPTPLPRNRPKAATKPRDTKPTNANRKTGKFRGWIEACRRGWADPRIQSVAGVFGVALALFVGGSLISGLFEGAADYRLVAEGLNHEAADGLEPFHNWLGWAGAHLAFWLSRQGLGMGALAVPFWLLLWAWPKLTQKPLERVGRAFRLSLLAMLLLPWILGFVAQLNGQLVSSSWDHWIGASGHYLVGLGLLAFGTWGSGLIIAAIVMGFLVFYLQPDFSNWKLPQWQGVRSWFARDQELSEEELTHSVPEDSESPSSPPWMEESIPQEEEEEESVMFSDEADEVVDEVMDTMGISDPEEAQVDPPAAEPSDPESTTSEDDIEFEVHLAEDEEQLTEVEIDKKVQQFGEYDPKLDLSRFELPNIDLLAKHGDGKVRVSEAELTANKEKILETLRNFSIEVSSIKAVVGPTVTLYEIVPAPGIRISKIKNLEDDIALSLAALGIRIIAPIPGRGTIGIEVPNSNPDVVSMRTLIASDKFNHSKAALPIAIGKTISNETLVFDLAKMPHLLVAGATGQGKSVGLNAMLISLLYRKHPSQLKFVLVDPKKVELTLFNHIERHYLAKLPDSEEAIITDTSKVVATLNSLCSEMDQRYDLLKEAHCRNIAEYNTKFIRRRLNPEEGHKYLPYIVLVVDEFADLIMTAGKEVETPIARLAQLARAIGIHLIIATQRPSVNIITGTIKANFPARIAFRVTSKIDSRTILDAGGADQLIGRGDMLMSTGNELIRLQCGFVDTPEVEAICSFIGSQQGYPEAFLLPEYTEEGGASESGHISDDERDSMFYDAAKVIVMHQQGSTSLLQRKLKLGYNRAGRIIDQLESAGIIGPFEGSKARKVLVPDESSLEQMLHKHDS